MLQSISSTDSFYLNDDTSINDNLSDNDFIDQMNRNAQTARSNPRMFRYKSCIFIFFIIITISVIIYIYYYEIMTFLNMKIM